MSKFDRAELLAALKTAAAGLAKSSAVPGLDHFWFDEKFVYAYDGGLGVRVELESDITCGLPGKPLIELLQTSALKEVEIEWKEKTGVTLKMGKSVYPLVSKDFDRFEWRFPEGWGKKSGVKFLGQLKLSEEVLGAITKVGFARLVGKPTQVVHNGVLLHPLEDTVEFYVTDSASMVRSKAEASGAEALGDILLPWGFVDQFLEVAEPDDPLVVLEDCLMVDGKTVRICSNRLELPDEPNLPKRMAPLVRGEDDKFVELPPGLQAVMDRTLILANRDEDGALVKIEIEGKALSVSGKYALGAVDEEFTLKSSLPDAAGLFKAGVVRRGLSQASSFRLTDKVFVIDDGGDVSYVMAAKQAQAETKRGKAKAEEEDEEEGAAPRRGRGNGREEPEEETGGKVPRRRNTEPEEPPREERRTRKRPQRGDLDDEIPF